MDSIVLNGYYTLIAATIVLLIGRILVQKIQFLDNFNIPESVSGGLLATVVIFVLYKTSGMTFKFDTSLSDTFMLVFFSSIGLSADFSRLKQGGKPLFIFLIVVAVFILLQDLVGIAMAKLLGLDPLMGLLTGSITLTGGHGTGSAWGKILSEQYGINNAVEMALASATFGLVAGGIIGGPVARYLTQKMHLKPSKSVKAKQLIDQYNNDTLEDLDGMRLITATSAIETMALFSACLAFSALMANLMPDSKLPQFVWALGFGVILRNILTRIFKFDLFDRAIDIFGNASLSLFVVMQLMNIKLWELAGIAGSMLVILCVQVFTVVLFVYFVTFRVMGKNYDAAVLAAGHCGFGLGATPTAVANMQSVTEHFGPSHKAFLIVPLVGAFFTDLINAGILTAFVSIFE